MEREVWYRQYLRVTPQQFRQLAEIIRPNVKKVDTNWRKAITVEERLAVMVLYRWSRRRTSKINLSSSGTSSNSAIGPQYLYYTNETPESQTVQNPNTGRL